GVMDEEGDVAYAFNQYHLISAPVVDEDGRLAGVITIDDAMAVLDEEHEEDILRLAGVGEESSVSDGVLDVVRQRLPWLVVNLFTASLSAIVISQFTGTIARIVALAALMPIVASTGGIAGTQALAVAVRALATRDLTSSNAARVVRREIAAGLLNGLSLVVNQIVACLAGVTVPLVLHRIGLDPALASGTFVTTLTDVMGFLAFLGLATMILTWPMPPRWPTSRPPPAPPPSPGAGRHMRHGPPPRPTVSAPSLAASPAAHSPATCRCGRKSTACRRWKRMMVPSPCR